MKDTKNKKPEAIVRVSVSFKRPDYAELEAVAREKKVSIAWVVRDAVNAYLTARSPLFRASPNTEAGV